MDCSKSKTVGKDLWTLPRSGKKSNCTRARNRIRSYWRRVCTRFVTLNFPSSFRPLIALERCRIFPVERGRPPEIPDDREGIFGSYALMSCREKSISANEIENWSVSQGGVIGVMIYLVFLVVHNQQHSDPL